MDLGLKGNAYIVVGGTLGMGGDYGFAWNPHGDYAKELDDSVDFSVDEPAPEAPPE